ncbi:hypothetical protein [Bifidobacterium pseudocatenulatum]|nr:hypothetical protein [Bifidobacterium pseudocatenulatum]
MASITINGRTFANPLGYISDHDRPGNETLTFGNTFALFMV